MQDYISHEVCAWPAGAAGKSDVPLAKLAARSATRMAEPRGERSAGVGRVVVGASRAVTPA